MPRFLRPLLPALLLLLALPFAAPFAASGADAPALPASTLTGGWQIDSALGTAKAGKEAEFAKDRAEFAGFIEVIDISRGTWALFMAEDGFMITDAAIEKVEAAPGGRYALQYRNIPKVMVYTVKDKDTLAVDIDSGTLIYKRLPQNKIPKRPKPGTLR